VGGVSAPLKAARVLLVDDHPALLRQARRLLDAEFDIVGTLSDGTDLAETVARQHPDIVVLDITLPGANGIELAAQLKAAGGPARIVFLTVHCDTDYLRAGFAAGASGYVVKSRMVTDLVPALHEVLRGGNYVSACPELETVLRPIIPLP